MFHRIGVLEVNAKLTLNLLVTPFFLTFVDFYTNFVTKMKKIFIAALAIISAATLKAEGYQINTLSARQLGMGHTGTALKLGAENMIFNPAGLAFSDKTLDITASVTGIKALASADYEGSTYHTQNGLSTPMAINAAFRIYDNLQAGVSFYTPYGSSINWTRDWPGAVLSQKVNLKIFSLQPTVSWRIIPGLSVGAGMMITWGNVKLDKALISGRSYNSVASLMQMPLLHDNDAAASVNLTGSSQVSLGANVGVMYDIDRRWTVGASFRTEMRMKVKAGEAAVDYATDEARRLLESKIGLIHKANFKASMPAPYVLNFGVAYKPVDRLQLAFDAQLTGWGVYKDLNIEFPEHLSAFDQHIVKDYKNSWCFKLGGEFALTRRFDVRAGLMVDTSPVNLEHYNPETPGMTKIEPTVGFSFRPVDRLSVDVAFMYIAGLGADNASCDYDDLLFKSLGRPDYTKTFTADYHVHAFAPSIGIRYAF